MGIITKFLRGVFYFFVGDWIILGGVAITLLVVALLEKVITVDALKGVGAIVFLVGVALTLFVTLRREIFPK
ncbi:MAG: hypothetical protein J0I20_20285 [Chloroflexi bacterium]|nr:hypothetical protein [Chloroflexota bacterium]OJV99346.1 MAG: hypothetical protein BGO39_14015 [Chloroflexi bacterium 54-19]